MDIDELRRSLNRQRQNQNQGETGMNDYQKAKKRIIKYVAWGVGALVLLIILLNSTTRVNPGYGGVKFSLMSGMQDEIESSGLVFHAPWVNVYEYPVSTEVVALRNSKKDEKREDNSLQINTGDSKSLAVDVRYSYKMEEEKLSHIFTRFRRQPAEWIADNYIKAEILDISQSITTKHSVLEVYSKKREEIAVEVKNRLTERLAKDGIVLESFTFTDVRPDEKTQEILQRVADSENERELLVREEKKLEQEKNNIAQQKENEALAAEEDKKIAKINAEKKAETTLIEAEAQAEANRKLAASMTEALVNYEWIKKWDGIQPKVSGGSSIIQTPGDFLTGSSNNE